eukprot:945843-Pleurochrysis_carterae.AAC.1
MRDTATPTTSYIQKQQGMLESRAKSSLASRLQSLRCVSACARFSACVRRWTTSLLGARVHCGGSARRVAQFHRVEARIEPIGGREGDADDAADGAEESVAPER